MARGTFLIEAALMAKNIAPGTFRKKFNFQKFKNFDAKLWQELVNAAIEAETECEPQLIGFDISRKCIQASKKNAMEAGVEDSPPPPPPPPIVFQNKSVGEITEAVAEKGQILVNPPYGERLR